MTIQVDLNNNPYDIIVGTNILNTALQEINLKRKVMIVVDGNLSQEVLNTVAGHCSEIYVYYVCAEEVNKNLDLYTKIMDELTGFKFDRHDCIIALGGGMVGDVTGFVASTYMRGIDFYNIPTTLLAQVDSSIGGKTGVNFMGYKNIIGSFYQPKKVIIDTKLLETLSERTFKCGVAEAIKMAATFDADFFDKLSKEPFKKDLENNIIRCLYLKKNLVERDEKESGARKLLNFGHTLGHAIESYFEGDLKHGECIATGMLPMCVPDVRNKIINVFELNNIHIINLARDDIWEGIIDNIKHDKKLHGDNITIAFIKDIGEGYLQTMSIDILYTILNNWRDTTYKNKEITKCV